MKALLYTALLALPVPLLILHSGWMLWRDPDPAARTQSLGFGLLTGGLMVFWLWLLAAACRPGGLGGAHFRWPAEAMQRLRRVIFVFTSIYVPTQLMVILCFYSSEASYFDGLGRVLFIAAHIGWAWLIWRQCRCCIA